MRVRIDRELCIGSANCASIASSVFQLDEEDKATVLDPKSVSEDTLWEAAQQCPTSAIILEDEAGKRIFP